MDQHKHQQKEKKEGKQPILLGNRDNSAKEQPAPASLSPSKKCIKQNRTTPFVGKLYQMLQDVEDSGQTEIVSWVANGRAFKVYNIDRFLEEIIPSYFQIKRYRSFLSQLYEYSFVRINSGEHVGGYSHPAFVRGSRSYQTMTRTKKSRSTAAKKKKSNQPPKATSMLETVKQKISTPLPWLQSMAQSFFHSSKKFFSKNQPGVITNNGDSKQKTKK